MPAADEVKWKGLSWKLSGSERRSLALYVNLSVSDWGRNMMRDFDALVAMRFDQVRLAHGQDIAENIVSGSLMTTI